MKIAWTRLAIADLQIAHDYIAADDPAAAGRVVERIETATEKLARFPEIGRRGRIAGTRELVVAGTPFVIPYRLHLGRIEILAVIHGARKWPDSL